MTRRPTVPTTRASSILGALRRERVTVSIVGAFVLLVVAMAGYNVRGLEREHATPVQVEVTGRQRFLVQQYISQSWSAADPELTGASGGEAPLTLAELKQSRKALLDGGTIASPSKRGALVEVPRVTDPGVRAHLQSEGPLLTTLERQSHHLVRGGRSSPTFSDDLLDLQVTGLDLRTIAGAATAGETRGAERSAMLKSNPVDVLITDWMMPGLDGPELCRRVRDDSTTGYTYIVIATSLTERDEIVEGMQAGADDFLTKPVDPFDVSTRLIAAERVTALHHQIDEFRDELEGLNAALTMQARTDPLTQLGNRLRLHEDLETTHAQARASGLPYSIAMCDIDLFKSYNDTYGHLDGDEVLRKVAAAIAGHCRSDERAYRYGGEEFVIVYAGEKPSGTAIAGERLRGAVEALGIPDATGVVTISVGIASFDPTSAADTDTVLRWADAALYEAKATGRNRVVSPMDPAHLELTTLTG